VGDCPACGSEPRPAVTIPERPLVAELCVRRRRRTFVIFPPRDLALDVEQIYELLTRGNYQVRARGQLGTTFTWGPTGLASLVVSGILIVEGARDEQEAGDLYRSLVGEGLGTLL
jgi:hypothetical protein